MDVFAWYDESAFNRRDTYAFLARMFRVEIDESLLSSMKKLSFESNANKDGFSQGMKLLGAFLSSCGFSAKTDLAVDYAKVFLGAGISDGKAAFPYESVYTSPDRLMMQDSCEAMLELFRTKGVRQVCDKASSGRSLALALGENHEPADHLALELDYMTLLIEEGYSFSKKHKRDALLGSIQEQRQFLTGHLLNWVPRFCADIEIYSNTDFYRGVGKMLVSYAKAEADLLAEVPEDWGAK